MHINDQILGDDGKIDQHKIDLVSRLGGSWYGRATGQALFEVPKPLTTLGIGVDGIPEKIRTSTVLTGNDLGQLGNVEELPALEHTAVLKEKMALLTLEDAHRLAQELISYGNVIEAWQVLLSKTSSD